MYYYKIDDPLLEKFTYKYFYSRKKSSLFAQFCDIIIESSDNYCRYIKHQDDTKINKQLSEHELKLFTLMQLQAIPPEADDTTFYITKYLT